jgi:excisionase family DNA binding protein
MPETHITWLTPHEAARRLGVTVRTLHRWEAEGRISTVRTPTNHRRYDQSDVDALLKAAS